jgi:hypothetical protein
MTMIKITMSIRLIIRYVLLYSYFALISLIEEHDPLHLLIKEGHSCHIFMECKKTTMSLLYN